MEKVNFRISKSTIECYKLRCDSFYWADINIDESDKAGRIQIASDFGNWQNYWGACGIPFKEFLLGLNIDYAAGKFGANKWFDLDKTISGLKEIINQHCENNELKTKLFKEVNNLESASGKNEFMHIMQNCESLLEFTHYSPDIVFDIEPGFKNFWKSVWPVFIKNLKDEI